MLSDRNGSNSNIFNNNATKCHKFASIAFISTGILAPIPQVQTTFPTLFPSISLAPVHQTWNWVIGSPGQWVIFHVRVIISTRSETRVFPVFHCKRLSHNYGTTIALPGTMQILLFGAGYKYSYLLTYLVEYSIRYSTEYSSSKKLDSPTPTHK